jgi:hypothetical protein
MRTLKAKENAGLVPGRKMGLLAKLFGCRHNNISRPFTHGKISYRICLECGARRQFNPETLETEGSFYFAPAVVERQAIELV